MEDPRREIRGCLIGLAISSVMWACILFVFVTVVR